MRNAFVVDAGTPLPAHVALVDDVMTTGSTASEIAAVIKHAGAATVEIWTLARTPRPDGA